MDEAHVWMAKAAIAELITRYAALSDAGEWEAVASLYTDDARMTRPTAPNDFIVGRDAILTAFRSRRSRAARHVVTNVLVTLDSETDANASSQILLFTGAAEAGHLPMLSTMPPLIGTYRDRLTCTGLGWRFAERRGSLEFRPPTWVHCS